MVDIIKDKIVLNIPYSAYLKDYKENGWELVKSPVEEKKDNKEDNKKETKNTKKNK